MYMNSTSLPKTRKEAQGLGTTYYFTGRPCKHGHVSKRNTKHGDCMECRRYNYHIRETETRKRRRERYYSNIEQQRHDSVCWYQQNTERALYTRRQYYQHNKERALERQRQWEMQNIAYVREWQRKYQRENRQHSAKRRASFRQAVPQWYDHDAVALIYKQRQELEEQTNIPYHVDHIVPLNGERVCGLHWSENLQVLPASENIRKSNKHEA